MQRVQRLLRKQTTRESKEKKSEWDREQPAQPVKEIELDMFLDNAQPPRILATLTRATG